MPRALVGVAVAAVLALASCSAAESSDSDAGESETVEGGAVEAASTPAADGPTITGTGYTFKVPKRWGPSSQDIPGFDPDSYALDLRDRDGFADNVNVIAAPGGPMSLDQAEVAAKNELESVGAEDVTVHDRVSVAGRESAHVTAGMSLENNNYTIEQFYPVGDDETLVVTFSFSDNVEASERAEVTDAVLSTWTWTD